MWNKRERLDNKKMKPQPSGKEYFLLKYNNMKRFISYQKQFSLILEQKPKSVLEVGKGNGFLFCMLKQCGIKVKTFDINKKLNPDVVGDMKDIS